MAANGESEDSDRSKDSFHTSETVVLPARQIQSKAAGAKKSPSGKNTAAKTPPVKTAPKPAYSAADKVWESEQIRRNKKIAVISVCTTAAVLVLCLCIGLWFYFASTADNGLIMDNTYVAGINIGGMTPENASAYLHNAFDTSLSSQSVTLTLADTTVTLSPEETKVKLDIDMLIAEAYQFGREGSRSERVAAMAAAALSKREMGLLTYMTLDTAFIKDRINSLLSSTGSTLVQPSFQIEGTRPSALNPADEDAIGREYQTLTIMTGTPGRSFDTEAVYNSVLDAYNHLIFDPIVIEYTVEDPEPVDLAALIAEYCTDPVSAELNTDDYTVSDEIWGYGFDATAAENLLRIAQNGETVTLSLTYLKPEVTRKELEDSLFQDVLASADTIYYLNPDRTNNLVLACQAIDGYIVKPGESFSFNEVLGERTEEKGYKLAGAYVDGDVVDQLGGGICQVASTLYYCTLYADLEILEREEHMYTADYLPLGMDATVNWGTLDFRFRNNTEYPVRIQAKAEDSYVSISLLGTDDKGYYIVMDYTILKEYGWETVEMEMDEDNKDGYTDGETIQYGWTGYSVDTYKYRYDKETDELYSCTLESHSEYSKRDKLVCKIKKSTEDTTLPEESELPDASPESTDAPADEADGSTGDTGETED